MMQLKDAKTQVEDRLGKFRGADLTTEVLNEIENITNNLIQEWAKLSFFVRDERGNLIRGIKVWYDLFTGELKFAFRYPSQPMNVGRQ